MMLKSTLLLLVMSVAAGVGSFLATVAARPSSGPATQPAPAAPSSSPLGDWLALPSERAQAVETADPGFADASRALSETLAAERERLAAVVEDASSTDAQIREQVERVIAAHSALERRVTEHILALRPHLTAAEQKRLLGLCAQGVRSAARWRWRGGRGAGVGARDGRGRGAGGGGGGGRGRGPRWLRDDAPARGAPGEP